MFGLSNGWSWLIFILVLGLIFGVCKYLQKGLESPYKERAGLKHVAIMLVIVVMFTLPRFVYFVPDPGEIKNLDQAISRIERQDEKLGKLYEELNDIKDSVLFFVVILGFLMG